MTYDYSQETNAERPKIMKGPDFDRAVQLDIVRRFNVVENAVTMLGRAKPVGDGYEEKNQATVTKVVNENAYGLAPDAQERAVEANTQAVEEAQPTPQNIQDNDSFDEQSARNRLSQIFGA